MNAAQPTDSDIKIGWMRSRGVLQAQWSPDGNLLMAVLGPERVENIGPIDQDPRNEEPDTEDLLLASA